MDNVDRRLEKMTPLQRAVFALKETQARLDILEGKRDEPIAIVGMACRFPGDAADPASYWRLLCNSVDAVGETPPDRWNVDAFYDPDPAAPGKTHTRRGGFLDRIDAFDNHFFGISDREARLMDPQQRLLLELSWEALEDAGLPPSRLRGSRIGVFVGLANSDYGMLLFRDASQADAYASTGISPCIAANRISFAFDFCGPSLTTDTACSSSLVAVHLACQSIRSGEAESALAGGVNLMLSPVPTINLGKSGFLAADGCVRAFDAAASGYVRGEGAGVLVLKPLSAALEDGDCIYAVIRGSAVNQNGASNGLTAPSRHAQEKTLRQAYAQAKVQPGHVQYVETQGTGTRLGDAIEAMALGSVMREGRTVGSRCVIGSVKTNIGHLEAASGMASIIKVALAMKHGQLPATLHFETPSPDIPFDELLLTVQQTPGPWPNPAQPRLAGVSAFGYGGSNAHIVLEQAPARVTASPASATRNERVWLLPLSARTEKALDDLVLQYLTFLHDSPPRWPDVCYTAAQCRDHHDCRIALVAASHREAIALLEAFLAGESSPDLFAGRKPVGRDPRITFVYAGGVEGWAPHGSRIGQMIATLPEASVNIDRALRQSAGWPLSMMFGDNEHWIAPDYALPAMVAFQQALTAWFGSVGVSPDAVLGQGAGEFAAAQTAGLLTTAEAIQLAVASGRDNALAQLGNHPARPATLPFISAGSNGARTGPCTGMTRDSDEGLAAAIESLHDRQVDCCLEIGPAVLTERIAQSDVAHHSIDVAVPSLGPLGDKKDGVLTALGALYSAGADLLWNRIVPPDGRRADLPSYPWQRQRLWAIADNPFIAAISDEVGGSGVVTADASECETERSVQLSADRPLEGDEIRVRPDLNTPYVAPRTPMEEQMAQSWSEILSVTPVGIHDNFFELGGDSLQATILLNRLQEHVGEAVEAHILFRAQNIADMATYLRHHHPAATGRLEGDESLPRTGALGDGPITSRPATDFEIPRLARSLEAEQLLSRLGELTDEEVDSLLQETFVDGDIPE